MDKEMRVIFIETLISLMLEGKDAIQFGDLEYFFGDEIHEATEAANLLKLKEI